MRSRCLGAILESLIRQRNLAVERALLESLPLVEEEAQPAILEALLTRGQPVAMRAMTASFVHYAPAVQRLLVAEAGRLHSGVREILSTGSAADRLSAIELIVQSRSTSLAYLLAENLAGDEPAIKERCAAALETLAAGCLQARAADRRGPPTEARPAPVEQVAEALVRAIQSWELHFRPEVLRAAMWLGEWTERAMRQKLEGRRSHLAHAAGQMLATTRDPRLAPFALRGLAIGPLRDYSVRCVERAEDPKFVEALLGAAWLLADESVRRGLRRVRSLPWLTMASAHLLRREAGLVDKALALVRASGIPHERKLDLHRQGMHACDPRVRAACLWSLVEDPAEPATNLLAEWARQRQGDDSRLAQRELRRRRPQEAHKLMLRASLASPSDRSAPAGKALGTEAEGLVDARGAGEDRPGFELKPDVQLALRASLASRQPLERVRALAFARSTRREAAVADAIHRLTHDPDPVVRATAVALLGSLPGPASVRALRSALDDSDARVQANAIEALEKIAPVESQGWMHAKLHAAESRVRANAVKALLRLQVHQAGQTLLNMLKDPAPASRLSALWVVERLELGSLQQALAQMGREDPDPRVRRRANRLLLRLRPDAGVDSSAEMKARSA